MIESIHSTLTGTTVATFTLDEQGSWLTIINAAGAATLWCDYAFGATPADPVANLNGTIRVPSGTSRDLFIGPAGMLPVIVKVLGNGNEITVERRA